MPSPPDLVSSLALREARYSDRVAKLGKALIAMTRDLASCRRENAELERENVSLRRRLGRHR